ncbi:transcriptional attenuator, LytR family [Lentibacillus halodurans]|uniref:Transcriptional attenuator, LytR family n=1 Tax=Lentibacillus halodurans TaxID=237679 RepID=A0A1I0XG98_9BACI|nr:LCP family protein [Lentibacillus halodurans]SFA99466.1 transcriptional attenuator, LytR family [Lentibacillus halodurans]
MSKRKKWTLIIAIPLLLMIIIGAIYVNYLYNKTENMVTDSQEKVGRENETSELRSKSVDPVEDNVSVLFIGVDNSEFRDEEESRSDALILASFNKQDSSVKLLSIPRDSYVYVPEVDRYTKINHAHFFGGPRATIETVENFLHVPVDYYAKMNFEGFIEVVDSLGGITYDVPYEIWESDSNDDKNSIHLTPGEQQLNGEEALALARTRKYDNDVERGKRQQEILKTIANKAISASSVFKVGETIDAIGNNMTTNLSFENMKNFLSYGLDENITIETMNLSGDGGYMEDGLWYFHVNEESKHDIRAELRNHLDLEENVETSDFANDEENNNTY